MTNLKNVVFVILLALVFSYNSSYAGKKWINYTDLKNVTCVSMDRLSQTAYCGTSGGLFIVDLNNKTILNKFTNIDGLINNNITALSVDNQDKLWIGASDGSICILDYKNSSFRYIYDIKNSTENDKSINNFVFYGNNVFVATGFGVIKISTINYNFVDAPYYQLGSFVQKTKVFDVTILNNVLYAGTVSGIAFANLISSNLNNPLSWTNYNTYPLNLNVRSTKTFDGKVFAGSDNGFMYFDGLNWTTYPNPIFADTAVKSICPVGNRLYFISVNSVYSTHKDSLSIVQPFDLTNNCAIVASDNNSIPIIGVFEKGILYTGLFIAPNCPNRNTFNSVAEDSKGFLWGASGLNDGGFYKFDGTNWTTYTNNYFPALGNSDAFRIMITGNNTVWALNFGNGLANIDDAGIRIYNSYNSNLPAIDGSDFYCVPSGGAYDNNGLFWVAMYRTNSGKSLYAKTDDSVWTGFSNPSIVNGAFFENIIIDNYNTKWVVLSKFSNIKGVYFFNENTTINDPNDDIFGKYDVTSDFQVQSVNQVILDKNNVVWIATNNGVFTIDNPLGAIQNPFHPPAPQKVGIISGNLKVPFTESSLCIAVDVLNEKWIGTETNGIFHLSEDGSTLIEQFNISNSPILSNTVYSISVSGKSGRAYFGTLEGLSSIQTNAIQPVDKFDKIICKPNPYIIPSAKNPTLIIDGLVENSTIKIITLNGELVAEYTARQGRIDDQWNGMDKKGKLVPTGIYIVVAYNKDGSKVGSGKLAVIRK
jgi:ligand-binding sensor domain-containing protein